MNFSKYHILRGLVPYIAGVFLACYLQTFVFNYLIIIVLALFFLFLSYLLLCKFFPSLRFVSSAVFFLLFLSVGFVFTCKKNCSVSIFQKQKNVVFSGKMAARILTTPSKKEKAVRVFAKVYPPDHPNIQPHALLYMKNDSAARALARGDLLLLDVRLRPPDAPKNPDAFDYRQYLLRKGVSLTAYVDARSWLRLEHHPRPSPVAAVAALQSRFSELFAANGLSGPEYSVITAVLLGNDDTMEADLKAGYAAAGVSHILCVSGMHVGIIFMILNFLLKPMDYYRRLRFLKSLLLIGAVWFYAALTGLAPSVQRSATMFTFMTVGGLLRRNANIFHSLFASMFFLLLFNPLLIFEIGFEMSYLAVFGIVIFQPRFAALLSPKTRVGRYVWELVCVSVAAQLATFPLSVFYFGQFPNYFLLSNLSVMSLSFVVIVTGVVLLAVSWWPAVANGVGWLLTHEIRLMNGIISFINTLPYSVTDHLSFTLVQTLLIYGIIILVFLFLVKKIKILKYCFLSLIIVLLSIFSFTKIQRLSKNEITFYSIEKRTVVGLNQQGRGWLLLDSAAWVSSDWYDFNVKNHEYHQGVYNQLVSIDSAVCEGSMCLQNHFLRFGGKTLYFLSQKNWLYPENPPLSVDFLFVQDNAKISLNKLLQTFEIKQVIVGSAVSSFREKRWVDSCHHRNIPVYSLRENGYLTLKSDI